jgi:Kdo2-lipid IVA lauroyltransferase/acyltransferase
MRRRRGLADRVVGGAVKVLIRALAAGDPDRVADVCAAVARWVGPWLPAHRVGVENLRAAYPGADAAWIRGVLRGAWDNLGRVGGEYVHLGRLWDYDPSHPNSGRILTDAEPLFRELAEDGKPALCFSAHLANWELPAVAAAAHGMASAVVYRMPNNRAAAAEIMRIRAPLMGRLIRTRAEAAFEMAGALERGEHLGMLVDQRFGRGLEVEFFGLRCTANPTIARLARRFECPVIGVRVIRLPGRKFRVEATPPLDLPRDAAGQVDVAASMQMITGIVEGWIREHPEQWLWFHRRWRR